MHFFIYINSYFELKIFKRTKIRARSFFHLFQFNNKVLSSKYGVIKVGIKTVNYWCSIILFQRFVINKSTRAVKQVSPKRYVALAQIKIKDKLQLKEQMLQKLKREEKSGCLANDVNQKYTVLIFRILVRRQIHSNPDKI